MHFSDWATRASDPMACHGLQKGLPYVLEPSPLPVNRTMHGCWNFLAGGKSSGGYFVLSLMNEEAIPRPKLDVGDFLEFLGFLPDSSGIAPQEMEDCQCVPMKIRIFGAQGLVWPLRQLTASWFDPVSGEPYN